MRTERRSSYRITLDGKSAFLMGHNPQQRAEIRILNAAGGAAEMNVDWAGASRILSATVHLDDYQPFLANIVLLGPASRDEGEGLVAFRFQELTSNGHGTLSTFLCTRCAPNDSRLERLFLSRDHTLEVGPSSVSKSSSTGATTAPHLLRHYLEEDGIPLYLYRAAPATSIRLTKVKIEARGSTWALFAASADGKTIELDDVKEYVFYLPGPLAVTWFRTALRRVSASGLEFRIPSLIHQTGFRSCRRVAPPCSPPLIATFDDRHRHGKGVTRRVLDIADNGFSLEFDPMCDHLAPGERLNRVRVDIPLGPVELNCVLRTCHPPQTGQPMIAGFEVVGFQTPEDHDRWMRFLVPSIFPDVRVVDESMVCAAWSRLEQSGYLELVEQTERARLRAPFLEDWTRHAVGSGPHARLLLSCHEGRPVGVAAANLVYPRTCLVHSGGVDRDLQGSGRVLKLASASFLFAQTVADYSLMLFEANKPINSVLFHRFVQQYTTSRDNVFDTCTVYKWHPDNVTHTPDTLSSPSIEVLSATDDLLRILWEHQRNALSAMEMDAYSFSAENRAMQQFSERCARVGYERSRHVFFAVRGSSPMGALIAETGSEGMNVFSLLNACSITFFESSRTLEFEVLRLLLARAVEFYRAVGKGTFLFLGPAGCRPKSSIRDLGFVYVADGWRWLATKKVMPAYINYLEDLSKIGASKRKATSITFHAKSAASS